MSEPRRARRKYSLDMQVDGIVLAGIPPKERACVDIALAVLLAVPLAAPAAAQLTESQPGARGECRLWSRGNLEGTVLTRSADTLVVGGPT